MSRSSGCRSSSCSPARRCGAGGAAGDGNDRPVIETVLGPIEPERLGPTSMHEHLLSDASALGIPAGPDGAERGVVLDDAGLAATELELAAVAWRSSSPDSLAIKSGDEDRPSAAAEPAPLVV